MFIVKNRIIFYSIFVILSVASLVSLFMWGLKPSIDFKGGSIIEIEYTAARPDIDVVRESLDGLDLGAYSVRPTGDMGFIVRTEELDQASHDRVLTALGDASSFTEKRFSSVGPILGKEALHKSWVSIVLVLLAIVLFIAFAFRKVSRPVSSWKYGLAAIIGLAHNILLTAGVFAILGHVAGVEVDTLFVTALLVILGFSIHDTIVVFDRVRENLRTDFGSGKKGFDEIVGQSIRQTIVRSINTSLTTLLSVAALYVFGPETTRYFSLALLVGIAAGTYSSIFICSPLLVTAYKLNKSSR